VSEQARASEAGSSELPSYGGPALVALIQRVREPVDLVEDPRTHRRGLASPGAGISDAERMASLPALYPEWLGDRGFLETHHVRFPYAAGEMAGGIATVALVLEMARAGMIGFFGAGGLPFDRIEKAVDEIQTALGPDGPSWGTNLIHSPNEPDHERAVVDLYLRRGVRRVSASAFMALTPNVVRYAASGLATDASGRVVRRNHLFAKLSRPEVAAQFMAPAPAAMLRDLVAARLLRADEAALAERVPVAEDITVEADSGGHTDNRPLVGLFPVILALRDRLEAKHGFTRPIRVGAGGGLGTPSAVAAAFALGAAYVMTGSVNQSAVEAGTSVEAKKLLAAAGIADVIMAPAGDMFELGVKVQVLRRGTMFAVRAAKLYDLYTRHRSLDEVPTAVRAELERDLFRAPLAETWASTRAYWARRDPREVERAEKDPKHLMALVFRSYLGQASRWAQSGDASRRLDYQIWCGPAMGAFNEWVAGSFLADPQNRTVVQIARNLLEGAAVVTRAQQARSYGVPVPATAFDFRPRRLT
jgi:PfaD family protein